MSLTGKRVDELTAMTTPLHDDLLYIMHDPDDTKLHRKIEIGSLRDHYNVKGYGAVGDGVADDAAAINAAIAATGAHAPAGSYAWDTHGGTVLLPPGVYRIGATIAMRNNVRLVGAGRWNTTIIVDAAVDGITVPEYCQNWSLGHLTIRARTAGADIAAAALQVGTGARFFQVADLLIGYPSSSVPQFDYGIQVGMGADPYAAGVTCMNGVWSNIIIHRARVYAFQSLHMTQNVFDGGLWTSADATASARIGGRANHFSRISFESYGSDICLHVIGSNNVFTACWVEAKEPSPAAAIDGIRVERAGSDKSGHDRGSANTFQGGSMGVEIPSGGYYIRTINATGNRWINPGIDLSTGTIIRLEGTTLGSFSSFIGGRIGYEGRISVESENYNFYEVSSNRAEVTAEYVTRLYQNISNPTWQIGRDTHGVRVQPYAEAADLVETPGLYTTRDGGSAPFNAQGNVIIKSRSTAGRQVELWTGASPARRFRVTDTLGVFDVGIRPASQADASALSNTIYYSTDRAKLCYKDSGGTVRELY